MSATSEHIDRLKFYIMEDVFHPAGAAMTRIAMLHAGLHVLAFEQPYPPDLHRQRRTLLVIPRENEARDPTRLAAIKAHADVDFMPYRLHPLVDTVWVTNACEGIISTYTYPIPQSIIPRRRGRHPKPPKGIENASTTVTRDRVYTEVLNKDMERYKFMVELCQAYTWGQKLGFFKLVRREALKRENGWHIGVDRFCEKYRDHIEIYAAGYSRGQSQSRTKRKFVVDLHKEMALQAEEGEDGEGDEMELEEGEE